MAKQQHGTLSEELTQTDEDMRLWQQERAIFEATERICELMQEKGVNRTELARRLGKTKGYITQLLDGETNMTIRTMSDAYFALGRAFHPHDGPITIENNDAAVIFRLVTGGENWRGGKSCAPRFKYNLPQPTKTKAAAV